MADDELSGLQRELMNHEWTESEWHRLLPPWRRWYWKIRMVPKEIQWGWQRARRGYSDRDTWSFDSYLTPVIVGGLTAIRSRSLAYPIGMTSEDWDDILERMITGFEKIRDREDNLDDVTAEMWQALELFADNYFDLWD